MRFSTSTATLTGLIPAILAAPLEKRSGRTSAPSGCLSVGSSATYTTISAALTALGSSTDDACIYIAKGTYTEQLTIDYAGALTFYGQTSDISTYESNTVLITHGISSEDAGSLDDSSTINVKSDNFTMYNINVENSYGYGAQAVAMTANADMLGFYHCSFIGYQDTLYAKAGTQYYEDCYIEGAVDYIFGDASAWFDTCQIVSNGAGSITASSRETTTDTAWYVFNNVNVISNGTDLEGEVYLGRPWRVDARVMYQRSQLSNIINAAGWTAMADDATPYYYEYKNTGDGSDTSSRKWTINATGAIAIKTVLGDSYADWVDSTGTGSASSASTTTASTTTASSTTADKVASVASVEATGAVCTPTAGGSSSTDDTPAIYSAIQKCGEGGTIAIPSGTTYYINSVLNFTGCTGCEFQLGGTLKASDDLDYWEGLTAIIYLKDVAGITFTGSGTIDGNGQAAWDKFADDDSYERPTLFYIDGGSDLTMSDFTMINPPNVFHSVKGDAANVLYSNLNMSAVSTSDNDAKNTDGFDIGASTFVTLDQITVLNDDDCVAFKPGANHTTVTDITCTGSHGLSVGSLGKSSDDFVANIYVNGATMISSAKAVGIKTYPSGGSHGVSTVTNVTYENVVVKDSDYAIQIQSCYGEDDDYCEENPNNAVLKEITFKSFSGTTSSKYAPVTSNLDCGSDGTCDITISDYTVKTSSGTAEILCANTPSDLGVTCTDGASG